MDAANNGVATLELSIKVTKLPCMCLEISLIHQGVLAAWNTLEVGESWQHWEQLASASIKV